MKEEKEGRFATQRHFDAVECSQYSGILWTVFLVVNSPCLYWRLFCLVLICLSFQQSQSISFIFRNLPEV